jgi:hypothetical protein
MAFKKPKKSPTHSCDGSGSCVDESWLTCRAELSSSTWQAAGRRTRPRCPRPCEPSSNDRVLQHLQVATSSRGGPARCQLVASDNDPDLDVRCCADVRWLQPADLSCPDISSPPECPFLQFTPTPRATDPVLSLGEAPRDRRRCRLPGSAQSRCVPARLIWQAAAYRNDSALPALGEFAAAERHRTASSGAASVRCLSCVSVAHGPSADGKSRGTLR